jgi:hypothetical protein
MTREAKHIEMGSTTLHGAQANRRQAIARRWTAIGAYSAVAAVLAVVSGPWLVALFSPVSSHLASLPVAWLWVIAGIALLVFWEASGRPPLGGFLGVRNGLSYPPPWVAALLAIGAVITFGPDQPWNTSPVEVASMGVWLLAASPVWVVVVTALVVLFAVGTDLVGRHRDARRASRKAPAPLSNQPQGLARLQHASVDELRRWFSHDDEIASGDEDLFGHAAIAERVVARVTRGIAAPDREGDVAIIGPIGSGKSSVCSLVQQALASQPSIKVCRVSLWPYADAEAAAHAVLDAIVDQLATEVDTLAVRRVSAEYLSVVQQGSAGWLSSVLAARDRSSPDEVVERLDTMAVAAGLHIVVCIEDIERFASKSSIGSSDDDPLSSSSVSRLRSLLHILECRRSITLILASTSLDRRADEHKIARFVELVPEVEPDQLFTLLMRMREHWLSSVDGAFIDPRSVESRRTGLGMNPATETGIAAGIGKDQRESCYHALSTIMRTPRQVKAWLRRVDEGWTVLRGEVDLDELIIATALRVGTPHVFASITRHTDSLFTRWRKKQLGSQVPQPHPLVADLGFDERSMSPSSAIAVGFLVKRLFPAVYGSAEGEAREQPARDNPQSVGSNVARPYWRRMNSEASIPDYESDQRVLRAAHRADNGEIDDLVGILCEHWNAPAVLALARPQLIRHFSSILPRLCQEAHRVPVEQWPFDVWGTSRDVPGFAQLRRIVRETPPLWGQIQGLVEPLIERCIGESLATVDELHSLLMHMELPIDVIDARVQRGLAHAFSGDDRAEALIAAITPGRRWDLLHLSWGLKRLRAKQATGVPFDGWSGVARTLLRAVEIDAVRVLPVLATFVVRGDSTVVRASTGPDGEPRDEVREAESVSVDERRIDQLFGVGALRAALMRVPTNLADNPSMTRGARVLLQWAQSAA